MGILQPVERLHDMNLLRVIGYRLRMDPKAMLWNCPPPPPRQPRPGELLFEFVRGSDGAPMSCELRFHGESYGWEAQFFERGELLYARTATKATGTPITPENTAPNANVARSS